MERPNRMITTCAILLFCLSASGDQRGEAQKIIEVQLVVENRAGEFHSIAKYATVHPKLDRIIYIKEAKESGTPRLFQRFLSDDKESVLIRNVDAGVIGSFSLSRDGSRIVFSLGGITWWYESAIYIANLDGSGLRKLTESEFLGGSSYTDPDTGEPVSRPPYDKYYTLHALSPDGKKVMVTMNDAVNHKYLLRDR